LICCDPSLEVWIFLSLSKVRSRESHYGKEASTKPYSYGC
jgi:hypothetical protein